MTRPTAPTHTHTTSYHPSRGLTARTSATYGWLLVAATLATGCAALQRTAGEVAAGLDRPVASAVTSASTGGPVAGPGPNEDVHWLQPDDWFYATSVPTNGWFYVYLAKRLAPPSAATRNEAKYLNLVESKEAWASWGTQTRPATTADFQIGKTVICFEAASDDEGYLPPRSKDAARTGNWFAGMVTDVSGAYKDSFRVDTYKVHAGACRVAVP